MKSFVAAIIAAVLGAVSASFVLDRYQATADTAYITSGARLDKHSGH